MTSATLQSAKQSGFKKAIQMEEEAEDKELAAEAERLKALRESISWKIAVTKGIAWKPQGQNTFAKLAKCRS